MPQRPGFCCVGSLASLSSHGGCTINMRRTLQSANLHQPCRHGEVTKTGRELSIPRGLQNDFAVAKAKNRKIVKQPPINEERRNEGKLPTGVVLSKLQLPSKFKLLETFYEGLEAASSLIRIRRQMCTFKAVCKTVQSLSKRRFLLKHLAQIKYIFPEVLQLEYVRCQDPDTWDDKWDLRISLLPLSSDCSITGSPMKSSAGQTGQTVRRRKEFHSRLVKFARLHPEDGDIPEDPLPQHPLHGPLHPGGEPTSSSRRANVDSSLNDPPATTEVAVEPSNAECSIGVQSERDSFEFAVVKPALDDPAILLQGSSHFNASFRPFFSVKPPTGASGADIVQPVASLPQGPSLPCEVEEAYAETVVEYRVLHTGSDEAPPLSASSDFSNLVEATSHYPSPFRPVFSISKDPSTPSCSSLQSTPKNRHYSPSSAPTNTPPFLSPMSNFRSAQDLTGEVSCKAPFPDSASSPLPPKSHSIMRSLKFRSPVRSRAEKASDFDSAARIGPVSTPDNSALKHESEVRCDARLSPSSTPSTPASMVLTEASTLTPPSTPALKSDIPKSVQPSPFTPPLTAANTSQESLRPPLKNSKARSLQFSTPAKASNNSSTSAEVDSFDFTRDSSYRCGDAASEPPKSVASSISLASNPSTPGLKTPDRAPRTQDKLYSPPKRTKLNRLSLFDKQDVEKDYRSARISPPRIDCETATTSTATCEGAAAVECSLDTVCLQETSASSKVLEYSSTKDRNGISESDLDIIRSLPLELVQSVQEKEKKIKDESSRELAKNKRRQQMIGGVPKLFNQLRLIFQSLNRSVLVQNELVNSVLSSHPDITDKGEIVERLNLLVELAPDWMTTRFSHNGELLYRIEKRADVIRIQRRLSAAC